MYTAIMVIAMKNQNVGDDYKIGKTLHVVVFNYDWQIKQSWLRNTGCSVNEFELFVETACYRHTYELLRCEDIVVEFELQTMRNAEYQKKSGNTEIIDHLTWVPDDHWFFKFLQSPPINLCKKF